MRIGGGRVPLGVSRSAVPWGFLDVLGAPGGRVGLGVSGVVVPRGLAGGVSCLVVLGFPVSCQVVSRRVMSCFVIGKSC